MDDYRFCPVCFNFTHPIMTKVGVDYYQCTSCRMVYSDPLDNEDKVGGEYEPERNQDGNPIRLERIESIFKHTEKNGIKILDFGCGHGLFVKYMNEAGFSTDGFDIYNPEFRAFPEKGKYHLVTMTEVIEHLSPPYTELDRISGYLCDMGVVMIETSFVDIAREDGVDLKDFFYISPKAGHSTIFSHHALDLLMCMKGFYPMRHFNRNIRLYRKVYTLENGK